MADDSSLLATHRKALRDYHVLESLEVGVMLVGTEIKSVRNRRASLEDSFARVEDGDVILYNMHVSHYEQGGRFNPEPKRPRKLLLHRRQIERLHGLLTQKGLTLVPLRLYLKHGLAKLELAVCKGKRVYEKRDTIRERETDRELRRLLRDRQKRHGEA
ncbi:MAG: SsrA-binding protein SmpB [Candidatus Omnitrophica bacterium]|nr:SsrA-binding protein SmpB [Candidatus Omnitrophota bacterium]